MLDKLLSFGDMANNIITYCSVLYTIVTVVIFLVKRIKIEIRRRFLKKLIGNNKVTIHIPSRKIERLKPVVAKEDYNTFEKLRSILIENEFIPYLKYIPDDGEIEFNNDTANIIICGPKNSYIVKDTFDELENIKFINEENEWFFEDSNNIRWRSPTENKRSQFAFIGKILLKTDNYSTPVLLICGIHAIGSDGVAFFLSNNIELDKLLKKVSNKMFYCLISSAYSEDIKEIYEAKVVGEVNIIG